MFFILMIEDAGDVCLRQFPFAGLLKILIPDLGSFLLKMNETKLKDKPKKLCKGDDTPHQKKLKVSVTKTFKSSLVIRLTSKEKAKLNIKPPSLVFP